MARFDRSSPAKGMLALLLGLFLLGIAQTVPLAQDTAVSDTVLDSTPAPVAPSGRYTEIRGLIDWFERGGVFMYPLLLGSLIGVGVIIERFVAVRGATSKTREKISRVLKILEAEGVDSARAECRKIGGPIGRILHSGLARASEGTNRVEKALEAAGSIEVSLLQRGLIWLSTVANITPLLGFLGTVSGMIHAFATIAGADQISARLVAGGIEEALITTEAGLSIAIPVQAFHNYFVGRIDRFITEIEEGTLDLISALEQAEAADLRGDKR